MASIIQGTLPFRIYDVPMLLDDKKYWANSELTLEYTVTRDPSSGGDFCEWDVWSYGAVHLFDDDGTAVPIPPHCEGEVKRKILYQLDEDIVVERCIEDALNFV